MSQPLRQLVPSTVEAEMMTLSRQSRSIGWGEGRLGLVHSSEQNGRCLRLIENGRMSLATTTDQSPDAVAQLIDSARGLAHWLPEDSHRSLGRPDRNDIPPLPFDSKLFDEPVSVLSDRLRNVEKALLALDRRIKKVLKLHIAQSIESSTLVNTWDQSCSEQRSEVSLLGEVMAEADGQTEIAWTFRSHRFMTDVDWDGFISELGTQAVNALGGRPLPSGRYTVVMHPKVGCQLLNLIGAALSAEAVQMGRSFFMNQEGHGVAADSVTLVDDPLRPEGVSSAARDDEGTPHRAFSAIEDGVLKTLFYDRRSASRAGRESNGHGIKTYLGAMPSPQPSNFYFQPGRSSLDEMLGSSDRVFYVWDVMGLHMADPITGEFSLGASGMFYQNGSYSHPVRGVTLSGRLVDLLKGVDAVGKDLTWYGDRGSPHFLVSQVEIAGA